MLRLEARVHFPSRLEDRNGRANRYPQGLALDAGGKKYFIPEATREDASVDSGSLKFDNICACFPETATTGSGHSVRLTSALLSKFVL